MSITYGNVAAAVVAAPITFLCYQLGRALVDERKRLEITQGALGLRSRQGTANPRRRLEHAVGNLRSYKSVDDWVRSLPRSAKTTMKRVHRVVHTVEGIQVRCAGKAPRVVGWEHWSVCVDHETRVMGRIPGFVVGSLRFLVGRITEGTIDEFRASDGRLLAWSSMIAKGNTMRNMWFYQRSEAAKCLIWFYTVRMAVERCFELGLAHLDLGPSHLPSVKELKAKYGFPSTRNWDKETASSDSDPRYHCDYSGPFVDLSFKYKAKPEDVRPLLSSKSS